MMTEAPTVGFSTALQALVCLDGSTRAGDALGPARAFAAQRGEQISVIALVPETTKQQRQLAAQLATVEIDESCVTIVTDRADLVAAVGVAATQGATPVLSAFGSWDNAGQLSGLLSELVRSDVARVLAVGPEVDPNLIAEPGCILVSADAVHSIDPLIAAVRDFGGDTADRILLAHVVPPAEPGISYATRRNSHKLRTEFDAVVETAAVTSDDVASAIADLARRERASLIITRSWHTWQEQQPQEASNSLAIAAQAPCLVAIVS